MCKITYFRICVNGTLLFVKLHIVCNIKAFSFTYPLENFTLDWFFYTTSGCDGCDKYEVWFSPVPWQTLDFLVFLYRNDEISIGKYVYRLNIYDEDTNVCRTIHIHFLFSVLVLGQIMGIKSRICSIYTFQCLPWLGLYR